MRNSLRITTVLLASGLVVLAAGCGGSSSAAPPTTATTGPTTTQQVTTSGSSGNFASAGNCLQFAGIAAKIASAMAPTSGGSATSFQTESRELQALADAAPSDIKSDFQTIATGFSGFLQALQTSGYKIGSATPPTSAQIAALEQAARVLDTAKLKAAEKHLQAWGRANCK